jgi:GT2 family glycosyltransferase
MCWLLLLPVINHPPLDLCLRYTNVTLIQNQANPGFAAANNQAIKWLDDSDWAGLFSTLLIMTSGKEVPICF